MYDKSFDIFTHMYSSIEVIGFQTIGSINESFGVPVAANVVHIPIIREIVNHSALSN